MYFHNTVYKCLWEAHMRIGVNMIRSILRSNWNQTTLFECAGCGFKLNTLSLNLFKNRSVQLYNKKHYEMMCHCSLTAALLYFMPELLRGCCFFCLPFQFSAGEQCGPAWRRVSHLPVGGEGADQTLQRPQLFSSGGRNISGSQQHTFTLSAPRAHSWSVKDSSQVKQNEKIHFYAKLSHTWSRCSVLFTHAMLVKAVRLVQRQIANSTSLLETAGVGRHEITSIVSLWTSQAMTSLCCLFCRTLSPAAEWRTAVRARSSILPHRPSC